MTDERHELWKLVVKQAVAFALDELPQGTSRAEASAKLTYPFRGSGMGVYLMWVDERAVAVRKMFPSPLGAKELPPGRLRDGYALLPPGARQSPGLTVLCRFCHGRMCVSCSRKRDALGRALADPLRAALVGAARSGEDAAAAAALHDWLTDNLEGYTDLVQMD